MNLLKSIKNVFAAAFLRPSPKNYDENEKISRKICMHFARGNISLRQGKYMTTEQIEQRREAILQYDFIK